MKSITLISIPYQTGWIFCEEEIIPIDNIDPKSMYYTAFLQANEPNFKIRVERGEFVTPDVSSARKILFTVGCNFVPQVKTYWIWIEEEKLIPYGKISLRQLLDNFDYFDSMKECEEDLYKNWVKISNSSKLDRLFLDYILRDSPYIELKLAPF